MVLLAWSAVSQSLSRFQVIAQHLDTWTQTWVPEFTVLMGACTKDQSTQVAAVALLAFGLKDSWPWSVLSIAVQSAAPLSSPH